MPEDFKTLIAMENASVPLEAILAAVKAGLRLHTLLPLAEITDSIINKLIA